MTSRQATPEGNSKISVVVYIGHPYDLVLFSRLASIINSPQYITTAIVAKTSYFREFINLEDQLSKLSGNWVIIEEEKIPVFGRRFFTCLRNARNLVELLKKNFSKTSILISTDKSEFMANMLMGFFRKTILFQQAGKPDLHYYSLNILKSILYNLYILMSKGKLLFIYRNKQAKGHVHHFQILFPNHKTIYLSHKPGPHTITLPLLEHFKTSKKILIFGSRFATWRFFGKNDIGRKTIHAFYQLLIGTFPDYVFLYKPHPLETGEEFLEISPYFKGNISDIGTTMNSELFLLHNTDISHCFSIGSTSSKSAYEMGFSSKVFYRIIGLNSAVLAPFEAIFSEMPDDFFIKSLSKETITQKCIRPQGGEDLQELYKTLEQVSEK